MGKVILNSSKSDSIGFNPSDADVISKDIGYEKIGYGPKGKVIGNSDISFKENISLHFSENDFQYPEFACKDKTCILVSKRTSPVQIFYSLNGINWQKSDVSNFPDGSYISNCCFGNEKGFIVSRGNASSFDSFLMYSSDGQTWEECNISMINCAGIAYGNGIFIAIGELGDAYSSEDGVTWTLIKNGEGYGYWAGLCYGNNKFLTTGFGGYEMIYSEDNGATWIISPIEETTYRAIGRIYYYNNKFFTIWDDTSIASSVDGINWNICLEGSIKYDITDILITKDKIIVYKKNNQAFYSADGINWIAVTTTFPYCDAIIYNNDLDKIIGKVNNNTIIYQSKDGITWEQAGIDKYQVINLPLEITTDGCEAKVLREATIQGEWTSGVISAASVGNKISAYGNDKLIVLEANSATAHYSTDNANWTAITLPVSSSWIGLVFADGKFTANSMNGAMIQSADGIIWTQIFTLPAPTLNYGPVIYGDGKYIIPQVSSTFTTGYISEDGCATWQEFTWPSAQNWAWGVYGGGKFVFVSQGATFCYSTDGKNWTQGIFPPSGGYNLFSQIAFFNGLFIAFDVMSSGAMVYSEDGVNWTIGNCSVNDFPHTYAQGNGRLVLTNQSDNNCAYTQDGINWTPFTVGSAGISSVGYGNGQFITFTTSANTIYTQTYEDTILLSPFIGFTIEGISYTAYEGMTWSEWCDSKYSKGEDGSYFIISESIGAPTKYSANGTVIGIVLDSWPSNDVVIKPVSYYFD